MRRYIAASDAFALELLEALSAEVDATIRGRARDELDAVPDAPGEPSIG